MADGREAAEDRHAEGRGETVEDAKQSAIRALGPRFPGVDADSVRFVVANEGGSGTDAHVVAEVDVESWRERSVTLPDEPAERLLALVTRVVHELGLDATVSVSETDEELRATVDGDDLGLLIGKHGATIDALQHIAVRIALPDGNREKQVVIDAAGYRERREEALHRAADRAISEAIQYGRPVEMEPMRALERKVVHLYIRDRTDVETHSEGDEPDRRLVITPTRTPSGS